MTKLQEIMKQYKPASDLESKYMSGDFSDDEDEVIEKASKKMYQNEKIECGRCLKLKKRKNLLEFEDRSGDLEWVCQPCYKKFDLFEKARYNDLKILNDPNVSKLKNSKGETPLHFLAYYKNEEALNHPEAFTLKDNNGRTALHHICTISEYDMENDWDFGGKYYPKNLLKYPQVITLKDNDNKTPLHYLSETTILRISNLKKLLTKGQFEYAFKKYKHKQLDEEHITDILTQRGV